MDNFVDTLGIGYLLEDLNIEHENINFEDIWSDLYNREEHGEIMIQIEEIIFKYFFSLKLPETPVIYDYLILSLRKKDAIATFNWDPLLVQAYLRVLNITDQLPSLIFLHGNVAVGMCDEHKIGGPISRLCPICQRHFHKIKCLYPIDDKDYENDPFIYDQWNTVRHYLKNAFSVTIFGYSAPKTDVSAIKLLKKAWGQTEERYLEQIEIIDIKSEKELLDTWSDFIHTHHYKVFNSYFDSTIAKFPRRSIEAFTQCFLEVKWIENHKIPEHLSFFELERNIKHLLSYE